MKLSMAVEGIPLPDPALVRKRWILSAHETKTVKPDPRSEPNSLKESQAAANLPNREIVLFILGEIGGKTSRIDTESLAVECFNRYPSKFGLVKFPEYPDVDAVRVTLADLKKPKYGSMVRGNKEQGWILTRSGVEWYEEHRDRIRLNIAQRHPLERRLPQGQSITREKISKTIAARLLQSAAYRKYKNHEDISIYDFFDAMKVDQYLKEEKYQDVLRNTLHAIRQNADLTAFVEHVHSLYGRRYRTFFTEQFEREQE